jgi:hypothetical protein
MPTNSRGTFTPLRTPDAGQLPESARKAANAYTVACRNLADASARQAELNSPAAEDRAKLSDVADFLAGKVAHKAHNKLLADRRDVDQEVTGLTQIAESAEAVLVDAARHSTPPDASIGLEESKAAVARLAQTFALARQQADVARWCTDPTRPFVSRGASPVEQALAKVRDELHGRRAERSFFDLSGGVDISPLDPSQHPSMVGNATDPVEGIR